MKINFKNILWLSIGIVLGFIVANFKITNFQKPKAITVQPSPSPTIVSVATPYSTPIPVKVPNNYYADAVKKVKELGYDAFGGDKENFNTYHFNVLIGMCSGSADGHCMAAFFFYDGKYIGSDIPDIGASSDIEESWRDDDTITINYFLYKPDDGLCCPTGGAATVRFQWNGTKVINLDPIPSADKRM